MVAWIHCAHVNFLVRKDDDNPIFYVDGHLLLDIDGLCCERLDLLKKRFATPSHRVARIDVNGDQVAFKAHEHLALVGAPLRTQIRRSEPVAIKVAALHWSGVIDGAAAATWGAVSAPYSNRLVERFNPREFAAQRAFAATSPGHEWNRISCITRHQAHCLAPVELNWPSSFEQPSRVKNRSACRVRAATGIGDCLK
jgi:hypothetical protein